jgi:putative ABC transport system ATP-binding protein
MRGPAAADRGAGRSGGSGLAARAENLTKVYGSGDTEVAALRGVDLDFPRGRFTAIMGPSGSGKSTLMHCLAGLDTVSGGRAFIGDVELSRLSDRQLTQLRRDRIGFIFQQFNLLPTLTAAENITLPLDIAGRRPDKKWMKLVIDAVGLAPRLNHRPTELSGGQQQRVACARALITRPDIIFGDEPTGNLDSTSGAEVLSFLQDSVRELGQTVVMVTHDATAASYADEVVFLADGRVVDTMLDPTADAVLDRMKSLDQAVRAAGGRRRPTAPPRARQAPVGQPRGDWDADDGRTGRRQPTGPGGTQVPAGGQGGGRRRNTDAPPRDGARRSPAVPTGEFPAARHDPGGYPQPRRATGPGGGYPAAEPPTGGYPRAATAPPARGPYRDDEPRPSRRQPTGGQSRDPRHGEGPGRRHPTGGDYRNAGGYAGDGYQQPDGAYQTDGGHPAGDGYAPRGGYASYDPGIEVGGGGHEPARDSYPRPADSPRGRRYDTGGYDGGEHDGRWG